MDCLFPFVPKKAVEVVFCYETIRPNRLGGTTDTLDLLLKNVSPDKAEFSDIFFLHPSRLFAETPERTAEFKQLIEKRNDADEALKTNFNQYALRQTPSLLDSKDSANQHLQVKSFIMVEGLKPESSDPVVQVTVYDPDPQNPRTYSGKVQAACWLGTPCDLGTSEWKELHELGYSILQLRFNSPLGFGESCWLRIVLNPRHSTLVTPSQSVLDPLIPSRIFPLKSALVKISRRLAFRVTYEVYVVGPFNVREHFKERLERALTTHQKDLGRTTCLRRIYEDYCTNGTHHPNTRVGINDCWIAAHPDVEIAIGSINSDGQINQVLPPYSPCGPNEGERGKHLWKTGFCHIPDCNPQGLALRIKEELMKYATKANEGRTKEMISQALGIPLDFCALIVDFLVEQNLIEEGPSPSTDPDTLPRYWISDQDWNLENRPWALLFSNKNSQPRFTIHFSMSWINPLGPLISITVSVVTMLMSIIALFLSYITWRNG